MPTCLFLMACFALRDLRRGVLADRKGASGQSLDQKPLLNNIASIGRAELRTMWTDDPALLPDDPDTAFWCVRA
ncbi:hypothetical protein BURKHO8Y_70093 [Burkholderia sp. 8Y]|nr:hypothetical protein BURKHO8Y_70093 [Burkholderia sp. 8Y]